MIYLLTSKKLISLFLIRASQGVLISAGITTLVLLVVLFAWAYLISMSLSRLREASQLEVNISTGFNFKNLAMFAQDRINTIMVAENAIKIPYTMYRRTS